jgi:xanthine dehydrogenase accessory factor
MAEVLAAKNAVAIPNELSVSQAKARMEVQRCA